MEPHGFSIFTAVKISTTNMQNSIKKKIYNPLVKETFVYTATDVLGKAMSFVLLPIVSFYMSPSELGIATNFTVLAQLVILLAGMVVVNSLPYFYYEQDRKENNQLVINLLLLCCSLCILLTLVVLLFHRLVYNYLQLNLHIQLLSIFFVLGNLISQTDLVLLRLENKPKHFAYLQLTQIILHALIVILFVIVLRGGGIGKIYAEVLAFAIMGLVHIYFLYRKGYLKGHFEILWIRKLLKFGLPLLPHSVSFWFKGGMDKVFITTFCGLQFNGLYSMALSISSIFTLLVNSFFSAYTPYLQKMLSKTSEEELMDVKQKVVRQTYLLSTLFVFVALLALAGSWFIFEFLIDNKYLPALDYMPLIILANYVYLLYSFTIQYIYKVKKTLIMGVITFTGSVFQMLISYWFIQWYGVMGAAYSFLIGNILISIGIAIYSNSVYPMPWFGFLKIIKRK